MLSQSEIIRAIAHESATAERVVMVAKVQRKRSERKRTLERRAQRTAKWIAQGR